MPNQSFENANYVNSAEFGDLFARNIKDHESLSSAEKRQVEKAIELFPELRNVQQAVGSSPQQQAEVSPAIIEAQKMYERFSGKLLNSAMSISTDKSKGNSSRRQAVFKAGQGFRELAQGLPDLLSDGAPGLNNGDLQGQLRDSVLQPIERGDEDFHSIQNGDESVQRPKSDIEIQAGRLVNAAIETAPEALLGLLGNPSATLSMFEDWPINEASLLMSVVNGSHLAMNGDNRLLWKSVSDEKIKDAIGKIVQSKNGAALLGLLAVNSVDGGKSNLVMADGDRLSGLLKEFDRSVTKVRDLELELAVGNPVNPDENKEEGTDVSPEPEKDTGLLSGAMQKIKEIVSGITGQKDLED